MLIKNICTNDYPKSPDMTTWVNKLTGNEYTSSSHIISHSYSSVYDWWVSHALTNRIAQRES